jgi:hypothetical protein
MPRVDDALRGVLRDLRHLATLTTEPGRVEAAVQALPEPRRMALRLATVAREAPDAAARALRDYREELTGLSPEALLESSREVDELLVTRVLRWMPARAWKRFVTAHRGRPRGEVLEHLEWIQLGYLATSTLPTADGDRAMREYARLLDCWHALRAERRRRWNPARVPATAGFLLATGLVQNEMELEQAVEALEMYLPGQQMRGAFGTLRPTVPKQLRHQGWAHRQEPHSSPTQDDRRAEARQSAWVHLERLVAQLRLQDPLALLRRVDAGDPELLYLPRAATMDYKNECRPAVAREMVKLPRPTSCPSCASPTILMIKAAKGVKGSRPAYQCGNPDCGVVFQRDTRPRFVSLEKLAEASGRTRDEEVDALAGAAAQVSERPLEGAGAVALEATIRRLFPHTPLERRILSAFLALPETQQVRGAQLAVAHSLDCAPESVSRYIGKVRRTLGKPPPG